MSAESELEQIWSLVQAELARAVDEFTYRIWLEPLVAREIEGGRVLVEAPAHSCRWIRERFGGVLQASVELVVGAGRAVELVEGPAAGGGGQRASASAGASPAPARSRRRVVSGETSFEPASDPLGNPKLTFEQFVIGDCNRLAHAAALTVAELPAQAYNPLFICGPPGVGKTHLLHSIAGLLLAHSPALTVRYTTGEAFTNEFLAALAASRTEEFKARFRDVDILLLDDVQFLERKTRTEEEFFHTFNVLHDGGRQVVLTSDRPPRDLQALEDRLRERFAAGLVADIKPPGLPTRLAILRMRAARDQIALADEAVLELIAERVASNVRALEGALIRAVAYSSLTKRPLSSELALDVLNSLYPQTALAPAPLVRTLAEIQAAACEHFGVSAAELLSSARTSRIAWARQVAMYLARELTGQSLPVIGRHFGGRDHTTVLYAWRRTSARITADADARRSVETLRQSLDPARSSQPSTPPPEPMPLDRSD